MKKERTPTTLRQRVLLVAVGLLISAILCELILRAQEPFFHLMARRFTAPYPSISHPLWDHYPPPNTSVTIAADDLEPYEFFTNSLGCRHPSEILVPKPPGITRILVMGDSFTEGYRFEDTVAPQLEKRLNEAFNGHKFEVVNCGATTFSPILYYLRLKYQLLALQPDAIILNVDQTDIYDDYWRYRPKYEVDENGNPLSCGGKLRSGAGREVKDWIIENSYFMKSVSAMRSSLFSATQQRASLNSSEIPPPLPENVFVYQSSLAVDSQEWKTQVGFCLQNISRIVKLCEQNFISIHITVYPLKQQIRADGNELWNQEFDRRVEALCRDHQIPFFSAYDGMAKALNEGQSIYREKDIHYGNQGQRVWAGLISDYFARTLTENSAFVQHDKAVVAH